jgi:hypothetical protein
MSFAVAALAALFVCNAIQLGAEAFSPQRVLDRFLAESPRRTSIPYRAVRRLHASSLNVTGWLEAATEFDSQTGLRVRILAEGGHGRITGALKGVLNAERDATLPGRPRNAALTPDNYRFEAGPVDGRGLVPLRVTPRRRDPALVNGTIVVTAADAGLVRIEGRMAKSPSFWTRSIDVVRDYAHRGGRAMLVEVRSLADVKIIGPTQFVMSYEYESVDGQPAYETAPPFPFPRAAGKR